MGGWLTVAQWEGTGKNGEVRGRRLAQVHRRVSKAATDGRVCVVSEHLRLLHREQIIPTDTWYLLRLVYDVFKVVRDLAFAHEELATSCELEVNFVVCGTRYLFLLFLDL